jgi:hypothetical protein
MDWARGTRTVLALATAAAPLIGVLWGGWAVRDVLVLYWVENLIIGFWQWIKMATVRSPGRGRGGVAARIFRLGFFTVHYGIFCAVHGAFIMNITAPAGNAAPEFALDLPREAWFAVASMFVSHGVGTWQTYFANGRYRTADPEKLMMEPYKHIVVIHVAIIAGGFAAVALDESILVLVLIVLGKLLIDLRAIWSGNEPS